MSNIEKQVVTRMAPSPTGEMHIGNLRTALYSWLYAKQNNGKFILRIEDTDKKRSKTKHIKEIKDTLETFGLNWEEEYQQSKRMSIYQYYAHRLVHSGGAYICDCAKESTDCTCQDINKNVDKSYCIKLRIVGKRFDTYNIECKDELRGKITYNSRDLYDIVLLKEDGYPTYHLASVVDDHLMGVTDIFRGDEWLSSLPYHTWLHKLLWGSAPKFYHLSLICNEEGKKLSKRDGDFTANYLLQQGLLPSTILNYIALLGWHPSGNEEFFTKQNLIEKFDVKRLVKSPACYDPKKLKNLNLKHSKTEQGIAEYYELYKNEFPNWRLNHLLCVYQIGLDIKQLMNKIRHAFNYIEVPLYSTHKLSFYKKLVEKLKEVKELDFNNEFGILLGTNEAKNILQHLSDCGYNNKEINEWIRETLTKETKGLPAEHLLIILTIEELIEIFEKTALLKM